MRRATLLATLFAACHTAPDAPPPEASRKLTLALGGDVMFGRWRDGEFVAHAVELPGDMATADLAFVNLETSLCDRPARLDDPDRPPFPLLAAPVSTASRLANAGVDVVSVANNHALDCGPESMATTIEALAAVDVVAVGSDDRPSARVGEVVFYAATMHPPPYGDGRPAPNVVLADDAERIVDDVARLHRADPKSPLVVSLHWGKEDGTPPSSWQRAFARSLVDAGASVVAGHGPHVEHPTEAYRGALIATSLGNLVFDGRWPLADPVITGLNLPRLGRRDSVPRNSTVGPRVKTSGRRGGITQDEAAMAIRLLADPCTD